MSLAGKDGSVEGLNQSLERGNVFQTGADGFWIGAVPFHDKLIQINPIIGADHEHGSFEILIVSCPIFLDERNTLRRLRTVDRDRSAGEHALGHWSCRLPERWPGDAPSRNEWSFIRKFTFGLDQE